MRALRALEYDVNSAMVTILTTVPECGICCKGRAEDENPSRSFNVVKPASVSLLNLRTQKHPLTSDLSFVWVLIHQRILHLIYATCIRDTEDMEITQPLTTEFRSPSNVHSGHSGTTKSA